MIAPPTVSVLDAMASAREPVRATVPVPRFKALEPAKPKSPAQVWTGLLSVTLAVLSKEPPARLNWVPALNALEPAKTTFPVFKLSEPAREAVAARLRVPPSTVVVPV